MLTIKFLHFKLVAFSSRSTSRLCEAASALASAIVDIDEDRLQGPEGPGFQPTGDPDQQAALYHLSEGAVRRSTVTWSKVHEIFTKF